MRDPREISVQSRGEAAPKIRQRYWMVSGLHKLDALTRVLESERFDAMLVFVNGLGFEGWIDRLVKASGTKAPIIVQAGYDPVWYGILVTLLMETALLTPPVGMNLIVVQGIREKGDLKDVIVGTAPFIITLIVMIGLIVAFPGMVMWLPNVLD